MSTEDLTGTYWYCQEHSTVEQFDGCGSHRRIGPFDSAAEAAKALDTIAERNRRYDAEDAAWDG